MKPTWKDNFYFIVWNNVHLLPHFLVKKWHKIQISRLAEETYRHVPMYRIFWNKNGIFSGKIKNIDDFKKFPVITKQIIRSFGKERQLRDDFKEDQCEWRETSGSTGEPFRFVTNLFYAEHFPDKRFIASARRRFLVWRGVPMDQIAGLKVVYIGLKPYRSASPQYLFLPIPEFNRDPETALKKISIFKPELIESMTTVIEELARCALKVKNKVRVNIANILTMGEKMTEAQRNIIKKAFSGEAYNLYGLEEVGVVATECRLHYGFHIAGESYLVEILDNNGNSLPDGSFGRVAITSFFNDIMPFIKYDTGDEGMILPKRCDCGLNSRLLIVKSGRRSGYITVGNVRRNAIELTASLDEFSDATLRYQIVKKSGSEIEIHIIPASGFHGKVITDISDKWRKMFNIYPKVIIADSLVTNRRGKTPAIIEKTV